MKFFSAFVTELRERRLWPVAAALLVGIVAVPVALSKSPASAQPPLPSGLPVSSPSTGPRVSLSTTPAAVPPQTAARDPFSQQGGSGAQVGTGAVTSSAGGSAAALAHVGGGATSSVATSSLGTPPTSSSTTSGSGSAAGGLSPSTASSAGAVTPITPTSTPSTPTSSGSRGGSTSASKPQPHKDPGLSATQAYRVTLAITQPGGGLNTIDSLERLSVLPSESEPLLVELGVLHGGHRVLFAVEPGAVVSGPGECTPGPIDCQVLSLAPGQTETLSGAHGAVSHILLAVTSLAAHRYRSAAAARTARRKASPDGRKLINQSPLSALSLFQYNPALGAVVDLRNLTVGVS